MSVLKMSASCDDTESGSPASSVAPNKVLRIVPLASRICAA